jgi:hypothetical protein
MKQDHVMPNIPLNESVTASMESTICTARFLPELDLENVSKFARFIHILFLAYRALFEVPQDTIH